MSYCPISVSLKHEFINYIGKPSKKSYRLFWPELEVPRSVAVQNSWSFWIIDSYLLIILLSDFPFLGENPIWTTYQLTALMSSMLIALLSLYSDILAMKRNVRCGRCFNTSMVSNALTIFSVCSNAVNCF